MNPFPAFRRANIKTRCRERIYAFCENTPQTRVVPLLKVNTKKERSRPFPAYFPDLGKQCEAIALTVLSFDKVPLTAVYYFFFLDMFSIDSA